MGGWLGYGILVCGWCVGVDGGVGWVMMDWWCVWCVVCVIVCGWCACVELGLGAGIDNFGLKTL